MHDFAPVLQINERMFKIPDQYEHNMNESFGNTFLLSPSVKK